MGEGGCTGLCSAVSPCGPLEGLITPVSLESPPARPLEGGGPGSSQSNERCVCRAQIIILRNTFIGKNLLIKDVPRYISQCGGVRWSPGQIVLQTRAVFKDTQVTAFINCGRCFHHLFHRSAATYFSLRRQLRPNWVTPKVAHRGKPVTETRSPRHVYYPPSQRVASCLGELTRPRPDVHPADTMRTRSQTLGNSLHLNPSKYSRAPSCIRS